MDNPELVEFVSGRQKALLRRAYLLTGDAGLAEDLVQESLAKLWVAWSRCPVDNPDAYVRTVMTHTAISRWRRKKPREQLTAGAGLDSVGASDVDQFDEQDRVWRGLMQLPPRQRAVLVLRYYEDLSEAEICDALGVAPGTVRSQAAKAREKLRRLLADIEGVQT